MNGIIPQNMTVRSASTPLPPSAEHLLNRRASDAPIATTGVVWQRLVLGASCVAVALEEAGAWAQGIFAAGRMTRTCANATKSSTLDADDCSCDTTDASYQSTTYQSSVVSEWDLACGRAPLWSLFQSAHLIGFMVAMLVCGLLADRFGRRPLLLLTAVLGTAAMLATALAQDLSVATVARLLTGFGNGGFYVTLYVLSELADEEFGVTIVYDYKCAS